MDIIKHPMLGADVLGYDAANTSEYDFVRVRELFYECSVLCLRAQQLTESELLRFASRLGAPDEHFLSHYTHPEHADILLVSNIQEDGKDIGFADAGRVWHSDGSYMQSPVAISLLYAIEVPVENGRTLGATQFVSAARAYEQLDPDMKTYIEGLQAVHQVAGRRKLTGTGLKDRAHEEAQPEAIHPLVRLHPITGRPYLFVNKGECQRVIGLDDDEGLALIERLADAVQNDRHRHIHQWEVGDLLIWDNQAVQHLATFDYKWPKHRRLMQRITITEGTEPLLV